ncbi:MAG: YbaK/EbsC family protein [Thioalkalispiraceae bacterium]|jgi:Ala-tRNA(Pro) deacylase
MAMANTLRKFLADNGIAYDIVSHPYTMSSRNTATVAKIPAAKIAKPVILEDDSGYLMAVVPANEHVKIGKLNHVVHRRLGLATEPELKKLFSDCSTGAIPPLGQAYGMETVVDNQLDDFDDIYFEGGDHKDLVHIKGNSFHKLMRNVRHASIC